MPKIDYKYKTSFSSKLKCIIEKDNDKLLSIASLENLKSIIPQQYRENPALLPIAGNLCVANYANKNYDVMSGETILNGYKNFVGTGLNQDHDRNTYIGHITNVALTKFNPNYAYEIDSRVLEEDDVKKDLSAQFNVAIGGVIYATLDWAVESIIESNDPDSPSYMALSLSWEWAFSDYALAIGSKMLSECEIIHKDHEKFEEYDAKGRWNGGKSKLDDGRSIYRLIIGEAVPLGAGITITPAADVKGLVINTNEDEQVEEVETEKEESDSNTQKTEILTDISTSNTEEGNIQQDINKESEKSEKNISQEENIYVKENSIMKKIESLANLMDINDENAKEYSFAGVKDVIQSAIEKVAVEWQEKVTAEKDAAIKAEAKATEALQNLEKIVAELNEIKEKQALAEAEQKFTDRMNHIIAEYDLEDEDKESIANDIKGLDDAAFEKWFSSFSKYAKDKSKKVKAEKMKKSECKEKEGCASEEAKASVKTEEVLDEAKVNEEKIINSISTETGIEKYRAAFSKENVKITK